MSALFQLLGFWTVVGVVLILIGAFFLSALVLWLPWTYLGLGAKYFYFLPAVWHAPGFWDVFWLTWIIGWLRQSGYRATK